MPRKGPDRISPAALAEDDALESQHRSGHAAHRHRARRRLGGHVRHLSGFRANIAKHDISEKLLQGIAGP